MKIKFHQVLISAHAEEPYLISKEFNGFLEEIKGNQYINNENNVILVVRDGDIVSSCRVKDYPTIGLAQEITTYDGVTGVSSFGGNGFLLVDQGEDTDLTRLHKKDIRNWVKSHWKEGLMIEWESNVLMNCEPTRDTYAFKKEDHFEF